MATLKAQSVQVENNYIQFPSEVSLVSGLDGYVADRLAAFKNTTLASAISALDDTYLRKTATAVAASKATLDGNGKNISNEYWHKSDTVTLSSYADKAKYDHSGNVILDTYALKSGNSPAASVGYAAVSATTTKASQDPNGKPITDYIIGVTPYDSNRGLSFRKGNGSTESFSIALPNLATNTTDGLMSSDDKATVDRLSGSTQVRADTDFEGDLDNIYQTGIYNVRGANDWLHVPADIHNAGGTIFLFVLHLWSGGAIQLIFTAYSPNIYQRNWVDGGGTQYWTDWLKIAGTVVETYNG